MEFCLMASFAARYMPLFEDFVDNFICSCGVIADTNAMHHCNSKFSGKSGDGRLGFPL